VTIPDHADAKRMLRARMRATPVDAARHNQGILDLAVRWLEAHPACKHVALYHPMADEPDLLPVMDRVPGRVWYFPRIASGTMSFHHVVSLADDLTPGVFGILEPKPSITAADPQTIQAFFCPGLAFAKSGGGRLGRGKGYYDRYLSHSADAALRVGVTFPERLVDDTYAEAHDVRMHHVLS
jgi:5-formyltetrahydrofolate cyclo-ligase